MQLCNFGDFVFCIALRHPSKDGNPSVGLSYFIYTRTKRFAVGIEAGRRAFEKAFGYEIIPPDSEINQRIKEEAKFRRPGMYK